MFEKFIVHTDDNALDILMTINEPSGRLMHWGLRLSQFDFEVKYKLGIASQQADALPRLLSEAETVIDNDDDDIPAFSFEDTIDTLLMDSVEPDFMDLDYLNLDRI